MSRLTETLENDLALLEAQGISLTPEEMIWLNDLARVVENPHGRVGAMWAGAPIKAGGFTFWTLTLQSGEWFRSVACQHFDTEKMLHAALGFASAFGRDAALPSWATAPTFAELNDNPNAVKTVKRFSRRFRGTQKELQSVLFRLMPDINAPHPIPTTESPDLDDDSLLADLIAGAGQTKEYWQTQHSGFVLKVLAAMCKQGEGATPNDADNDMEYRNAFIEYDKALKACRDAHLKGADNGE